ncbi:MAG TPA: undecaprenyldiphospho-muramoylpentapeptide beta-N-acetylglucosaminyltransferase [Dermatophilaceae bacterium]|nr:undecaprenyldiphospho-muramoylpentapeptide beta-N-acetylglucosaminyltransferase [Dermatophilaceae bacterium]
MTELPPGSVVLAGGGSAGHVNPLLAVADCLRRRHPGTAITAVGTATGLEHKLVPERGYELWDIPKAVFPRRPNRAALGLPRSLVAAIRAADHVLERTEARVLVGFGGYVSGPAYLAARRRGVPIVVHEANARAGLANRLGARLTQHVATTFEVTKLPHATVLGMPLRREITTLDRTRARQGARVGFGLHPDLSTLLVTGGSLGAQRLNEAVGGCAETLLRAGVQVLHLTGIGKKFEPPADCGSARYVVRAYADRMELAYAAADLVLCRAGANTVCELTAVGLPAVYVPLPIGNGEQRLNAAGAVAAGAGVLVDDADLTGDWVLRELLPMALDTPRLAAMGRAAERSGHRDADERVSDLICQAAAQGVAG